MRGFVPVIPVMTRWEVESVDPWRLTGQLACMAVFQANERPCHKQKVKGAVQVSTPEVVL